VKRSILFFPFFILSFSFCSAQDTLAKSKTTHVNKEPQWKVLKLDSTEFRGKVNSKGFLFVTGSKGCLQTVYVNNMLVPEMYTDTIKIDFKEMNIKPGTKAIVKAIYLQSGKVWLIPGGSLDINK
jgi:hypothetical protein